MNTLLVKVSTVLAARKVKLHLTKQICYNHDTLYRTTTIWSFIQLYLTTACRISSSRNWSNQQVKWQSKRCMLHANFVILTFLSALILGLCELHTKLYTYTLVMMLLGNLFDVSKTSTFTPHCNGPHVSPCFSQNLSFLRRRPRPD